MIRRFLNDSAIYALPLILSRGLGFFLLPVYTHYLNPADYGAIELLAVSFTLLNLTLPLEVSQAMARFIPEAEGQSRKVAYAATCFWFTAAVFALFAIFCWGFPGLVSNFLFGSPDSRALIQVGSIAMLSNALLYLIQNQLRWSMQSKSSAFTGVLFSFITAAVTVLLIVVFNKGVFGYVFGQLAGATIALTAGLYFARVTVPLRLVFDFEKFKEMLSFSAPLVFSSIAVYVSMYTDRWMLRLFGDMAEVGIYSVSYRVASVSALAISSFQMALTPIIYNHYKEAETPSHISKIFTLFLCVVLPVIAFAGAFSKELIGFIAAAEFYDAYKPVVILVIAIVLMNIYIFAPGLGLAKRTKLIAVVNIVAATTNVTLNAILIPRYGLMGASVATLCGALVMAILYFRWGQKEYPIPFQWRRYMLASVCLFAFLIMISPASLSVLPKVALVFISSLLMTLILLGPKECLSYMHKASVRLRK